MNNEKAKLSAPNRAYRLLAISKTDTVVRIVSQYLGTALLGDEYQSDL